MNTGLWALAHFLPSTSFCSIYSWSLISNSIFLIRFPGKAGQFDNVDSHLMLFSILPVFVPDGVPFNSLFV